MERKSLRAPSENEQALYLQRKSGPTEWMNCGKYNSSASSELICELSCAFQLTVISV